MFQESISSGKQLQREHLMYVVGVLIRWFLALVQNVQIKKKSIKTECVALSTLYFTIYLIYMQYIIYSILKNHFKINIYINQSLSEYYLFN